VRVSGIGRATLYRYIRHATLPARKVGRNVILRSDLAKLLGDLPLLRIGGSPSPGDPASMLSDGDNPKMTAASAPQDRRHHWHARRRFAAGLSCRCAR
jgi:hypothetical protein